MPLINNPSKFADKFKIKSSRLNNFDYSTPGYYFITICTFNHNNFFGKIINNKMELSKMGIIAKNCLIDIPKHFSNITLDEYVVMPNHMHILVHVETPDLASLTTNKNNIQINKLNNLNQQKYDLKETPDLASLQNNSKITLINYSHKNHPNYYLRLNQKSNQLIPKLIQQFKSAVTRQINSKTIFFAWQPRFHDEIIKDEKELLVIKKYIQNNVINWNKDKYFVQS